MKINWIIILFIFDNFLKNIWGIFNMLSKLSQDPYKSCFTIYISDLFKIFFFKKVSKLHNIFLIFSKNILENYYGFISNIWYFEGHKVSQLLSCSFWYCWKSYNNCSKTSYRSFSYFCIYICYIFTKLIYKILYIVFASNLTEYLKFNIFDIAGLIVLNKKLLIFIFEEHVSSSQNKQMYMRENIKWNLITLSCFTWCHKSD